MIARGERSFLLSVFHGEGMFVSGLDTSRIWNQVMRGHNNLGVIKNGEFLKPILYNLIWLKLRKIGDGWKDLQKIFHLSCAAILSLKWIRSYSNSKNTFLAHMVCKRSWYVNNLLKNILNFIRLRQKLTWKYNILYSNSSLNFQHAKDFDVGIQNCGLKELVVRIH